MKRNGFDFYNKCLEARFYTLPFKPKHATKLDDLKLKENHYANTNPFDKGILMPFLIIYTN